MTPDRSWILTTLIAALVFLFRWQDEHWTLVFGKAALLVSASLLVAALLAAGIAQLS